MCGIAGYISKTEVNIDLFNEMVDIISHRGPNDRGVFFENMIALGHRRLSVIDVSDAGHQPFEYKNRYVVVYNGEIYNYIELRNELIEKGYHFKSKSDTEILVACYDYYGKECVKKFNGMWSFAVYDRLKKEVFISRDRFGIKPLYYSFIGNDFVFGSEIKQILVHEDRPHKVNRDRLLEYLIRGYSDHTAESMIEGVYQLLGGHNLTINLDDLSYYIEKYYDLANTKSDIKSYEDAQHIFGSLFKDSVKLRMRSDVPLGYCLSGGLDSSAIVCIADCIAKSGKIPYKHKTISSCFEEKQYDEQEYIDEVIRYTDVEPIKIFPKGGNVLDELDKLIWHMDEPFSSMSIYAQWNVFKGAKENGLTVMLDGQGADEQLAGYTGFYSVIFAEYLKKFRFVKFYKELKAYKKLRASTEEYVNSRKIVIEALISAYLPRKMQKLGKLYLYYLRHKSPFKSDDIKKVIMGLDLYPTNDSRQYVLDNFKCNLPMLLRYEDRNSMAFSIESRVPFLDYRIVESIFRMPIDFKIQNGITKKVMRDALKNVLPEKIRCRYSKLGFVTPEDKWINENSKQYREELYSSAKMLDGVLNVDQVMDWYDSISGNIKRMDYTAFRIICAGRWMRIFDLEV